MEERLSLMKLVGGNICSTIDNRQNSWLSRCTYLI